jgi:hypothetical protein
VLGQLHGRGAHAAGGPIDENVFAVPQFPSSEEMQRRRSAGGEGGGFIVGQRGRLQRHRPVFRHALVLGVTTHARAAERKHLIAGFEFADASADRLDFPGELGPENRLPWSRDANDQTSNQPEAGRQIEAAHPPVPCRDRRRMRLDQNVMVPGGGLWHLLHFKHVGRPISLIHDCFHASPSSP